MTAEPHLGRRVVVFFTEIGNERTADMLVRSVQPGIVFKISYPRQ